MQPPAHDRRRQAGSGGGSTKGVAWTPRRHRWRSRGMIGCASCLQTGGGRVSALHLARRGLCAPLADRKGAIVRPSARSRVQLVAAAAAGLPLAAAAAAPLAAAAATAPLPSTMLLWLAGAAAAWAAWTLFRFVRADADLSLLSKRAPPDGAWQGKVVWIVGASQGLGEALAVYWAAAGARVILSSRSMAKLQAVKERCCQHAPEEHIELLTLDLVGDSAKLAEAAKTAFDAFGGAGVDYLVHNAGASQHAAVEDTSPEVASTLLRLNLQGPLALARAALPLMVEQGRGQHVVIASMSAVVPSPGQSVYAAAKSGLRAYFASLTAELSDKNVGATVVCPGPLATGLDGKPRMVYGPSGLITQANTGMSKKRVTTQRAVELIARAAYHRLDECWIAYHPVLLLGYLMQYTPWLGMLVLKKVGPARAQALREGRSGYDTAGLIKSASGFNVGGAAAAGGAPGGSSASLDEGGM